MIIGTEEEGRQIAQLVRTRKISVFMLVGVEAWIGPDSGNYDADNVIRHLENHPLRFIQGDIVTLPRSPQPEFRYLLEEVTDAEIRLRGADGGMSFNFPFEKAYDLGIRKEKTDDNGKQ